MKINIPLPPLVEQRGIIATLEKEQDYVNVNRQFIEIFDQKITGCIAKAWGEK